MKVLILITWSKTLWPFLFALLRRVLICLAGRPPTSTPTKISSQKYPLSLAPGNMIAGGPMHVEIKSLSEKKCSGEIFFSPIPGVVRVKAALKIFLICFVLAVGFVFIPILHFVLVPLMLLLAPLLAWRVYSKNFEFQSAKVSCADCGGLLDASHSNFKWPLRLECPGCRSINYVSLAQGELT